jgi:hypothetical protein
MSFIIVPNFPEILEHAPIDSPEFRTAADVFLAKLEEALDGHPSMVKSVVVEYYTALRRRFSGGQDLDGLARRIGACRVVALFDGLIRLDEKSCAEGPMAAVNRFAAEHVRTCSLCSLVLKTINRTLDLLSAATDPGES